ncbi:MAG TPA: lipopolysaccharide heptosyltransferase I [Rhodocyclaceae bacterium]|nr:lipopolysaccharide heptosyltransferase I [Rhodocyclaceae bacterium]
MRILLVKTSSLGDVIHNLPVVSDLKRSRPDAVIDWCVEENFAAIPRLHPGVSRVIPVAIRRWRKKLLDRGTWAEIGAFRNDLRTEPYDVILDTQGLVKSALVARQARGPIAGYAPEAAREPLAARFYDHTSAIPKAAHAVDRNRWLAAAVFGHPGDLPLDYGIAAAPLHADWLPARPYAVFLTATSRDDKLWEEARWLALGKSLAERGIRAVLPAGNPTERERAARLAAGIEGAVAAPPLGLEALAQLLAGARLTVGVDTGLTHLSAALKVPTVALYTATEPGLTGVLGTGFCRNLGGPGRSPEAAAVFDMLQAVLG